MAVRILVLDDGETWSGGGTVMEITDRAYEDLCSGVKKVKHLDSNTDIVEEWDCDMSDPQSKEIR